MCRKFLSFVGTLFSFFFLSYISFGQMLDQLTLPPGITTWDISSAAGEAACNDTLNKYKRIIIPSGATVNITGPTSGTSARTITYFGTIEVQNDNGLTLAQRTGLVVEDSLIIKAQVAIGDSYTSLTCWNIVVGVNGHFTFNGLNSNTGDLVVKRDFVVKDGGVGRVLTYANYPANRLQQLGNLIVMGEGATGLSNQIRDGRSTFVSLLLCSTAVKPTFHSVNIGNRGCVQFTSSYTDGKYIKVENDIDIAEQGYLEIISGAHISIGGAIRIKHQDAPSVLSTDGYGLYYISTRLSECLGMIVDTAYAGFPTVPTYVTGGWASSTAALGSTITSGTPPFFKTTASASYDLGTSYTITANTTQSNGILVYPGVTVSVTANKLTVANSCVIYGTLQTDAGASSTDEHFTFNGPVRVKNGGNLNVTRGNVTMAQRVEVEPSGNMLIDYPSTGHNRVTLGSGGGDVVTTQLSVAGTLTLAHGVLLQNSTLFVRNGGNVIVGTNEQTSNIAQLVVNDAGNTSQDPGICIEKGGVLTLKGNSESLNYDDYVESSTNRYYYKAYSSASDNNNKRNRAVALAPANPAGEGKRIVYVRTGGTMNVEQNAYLAISNFLKVTGGVMNVKDSAQIWFCDDAWADLVLCREGTVNLYNRSIVGIRNTSWTDLRNNGFVNLYGQSVMFFGTESLSWNGMIMYYGYDRTNIYGNDWGYNNTNGGTGTAIPHGYPRYEYKTGATLLADTRFVNPTTGLNMFNNVLEKYPNFADSVFAPGVISVYENASFRRAKNDNSSVDNWWPTSGTVNTINGYCFHNGGCAYNAYADYQKITEANNPGRTKTNNNNLGIVNLYNNSQFNFTRFLNSAGYYVSQEGVPSATNDSTDAGNLGILNIYNNSLVKMSNTVLNGLAYKTTGIVNIYNNARIETGEALKNGVQNTGATGAIFINGGNWIATGNVQNGTDANTVGIIEVTNGGKLQMDGSFQIANNANAVGQVIVSNDAQLVVGGNLVNAANNKTTGGFRNQGTGLFCYGGKIVMTKEFSGIDSSTLDVTKKIQIYDSVTADGVNHYGCFVVDTGKIVTIINANSTNDRGLQLMGNTQRTPSYIDASRFYTLSGIGQYELVTDAATIESMKHAADYVSNPPYYYASRKMTRDSVKAALAVLRGASLIFPGASVGAVKQFQADSIKGTNLYFHRGTYAYRYTTGPLGKDEPSLVRYYDTINSQEYIQPATTNPYGKVWLGYRGNTNNTNRNFDISGKTLVVGGECDTAFVYKSRNFTSSSALPEDTRVVMVSAFDNLGWYDRTPFINNNNVSDGWRGILTTGRIRTIPNINPFNDITYGPTCTITETIPTITMPSSSLTVSPDPYDLAIGGRYHFYHSHTTFEFRNSSYIDSFEVRVRKNNGNGTSDAGMLAAAKMGSKTRTAPTAYNRKQGYLPELHFSVQESGMPFISYVRYMLPSEDATSTTCGGATGKRPNVWIQAYSQVLDPVYLGNTVFGMSRQQSGSQCYVDDLYIAAFLRLNSIPSLVDVVNRLGNYDHRDHNLRTYLKNWNGVTPSVPPVTPTEFFSRSQLFPVQMFSVDVPWETVQSGRWSDPTTWLPAFTNGMISGNIPTAPPPNAITTIKDLVYNGSQTGLFGGRSYGPSSNSGRNETATLPTGNTGLSNKGTASTWGVNTYKLADVVRIIDNDDDPSNIVPGCLIIGNNPGSTAGNNNATDTLYFGRIVNLTSPTGTPIINGSNWSASSSAMITAAPSAANRRRYGGVYVMKPNATTNGPVLRIDSVINGGLFSVAERVFVHGGLIDTVSSYATSFTRLSENLRIGGTALLGGVSTFRKGKLSSERFSFTLQGLAEDKANHRGVYVDTFICGIRLPNYSPVYAGNNVNARVIVYDSVTWYKQAGSNFGKLIFRNRDAANPTVAKAGFYGTGGAGFTIGNGGGSNDQVIVSHNKEVKITSGALNMTGTLNANDAFQTYVTALGTSPNFSYKIFKDGTEEDESTPAFSSGLADTNMRAGFAVLDGGKLHFMPIVSPIPGSVGDLNSDFAIDNTVRSHFINSSSPTWNAYFHLGEPTSLTNTPSTVIYHDNVPLIPTPSLAPYGRLEFASDYFENGMYGGSGFEPGQAGKVNQAVHIGGNVNDALVVNRTIDYLATPSDATKMNTNPRISFVSKYADALFNTNASLRVTVGRGVYKTPYILPTNLTLSSYTLENTIMDDSLYTFNNKFTKFKFHGTTNSSGNVVLGAFEAKMTNVPNDDSLHGVTNYIDYALHITSYIDSTNTNLNAKKFWGGSLPGGPSSVSSVNNLSVLAEPYKTIFAKNNESPFITNVKLGVVDATGVYTTGGRPNKTDDLLMYNYNLDNNKSLYYMAMTNKTDNGLMKYELTANGFDNPQGVYVLHNPGVVYSASDLEKYSYTLGNDLLLLGRRVHIPTTMSVRNGRWSDPFTWQHAIVPDSSARVLLAHTVYTGSTSRSFGRRAYGPGANAYYADSVNLIPGYHYKEGPAETGLTMNQVTGTNTYKLADSVVILPSLGLSGGQWDAGLILGHNTLAGGQNNPIDTLQFGFILNYGTNSTRTGYGSAFAKDIDFGGTANEALRLNRYMMHNTNAFVPGWTGLDGKSVVRGLYVMSGGPLIHLQSKFNIAASYSQYSSEIPTLEHNVSLFNSMGYVYINGNVRMDGNLVNGYPNAGSVYMDVCSGTVTANALHYGPGSSYFSIYGGNIKVDTIRASNIFSAGGQYALQGDFVINAPTSALVETEVFNIKDSVNVLAARNGDLLVTDYMIMSDVHPSTSLLSSTSSYTGTFRVHTLADKRAGNSVLCKNEIKWGGGTLLADGLQLVFGKLNQYGGTIKVSQALALGNNDTLHGGQFVMSDTAANIWIKNGNMIYNGIASHKQHLASEKIMGRIYNPTHLVVASGGQFVIDKDKSVVMNSFFLDEDAIFEWNKPDVSYTQGSDKVYIRIADDVSPTTLYEEAYNPITETYNNFGTYANVAGKGGFAMLSGASLYMSVESYILNWALTAAAPLQNRNKWYFHRGKYNDATDKPSTITFGLFDVTPTQLSPSVVAAFSNAGYTYQPISTMLDNNPAYPYGRVILDATFNKEAYQGHIGITSGGLYIGGECDDAFTYKRDYPANHFVRSTTGASYNSQVTSYTPVIQTGNLNLKGMGLANDRAIVFVSPNSQPKFENPSYFEASGSPTIPPIVDALPGENRFEIEGWVKRQSVINASQFSGMPKFGHAILDNKEYRFNNEGTILKFKEATKQLTNFGLNVRALEFPTLLDPDSSVVVVQYPKRRITTSFETLGTPAAGYEPKVSVQSLRFITSSEQSGLTTNNCSNCDTRNWEFADMFWEGKKMFLMAGYNANSKPRVLRRTELVSTPLIIEDPSAVTTIRYPGYIDSKIDNKYIPLFATGSAGIVSGNELTISYSALIAVASKSGRWSDPYTWRNPYGSPGSPDTLILNDAGIPIPPTYEYDVLIGNGTLSVNGSDMSFGDNPVVVYTGSYSESFGGRAYGGNTATLAQLAADNGQNNFDGPNETDLINPQYVNNANGQYNNKELIQLCNSVKIGIGSALILGKNNNKGTNNANKVLGFGAISVMGTDESSLTPNGANYDSTLLYDCRFTNVSAVYGCISATGDINVAGTTKHIRGLHIMKGSPDILFLNKTNTSGSESYGYIFNEGNTDFVIADFLKEKNSTNIFPNGLTNFDGMIKITDGRIFVDGCVGYNNDDVNEENPHYRGFVQQGNSVVRVLEDGKMIVNVLYDQVGKTYVNVTHPDEALHINGDFISEALLDIINGNIEVMNDLVNQGFSSNGTLEDGGVYVRNNSHLNVVNDVHNQYENVSPTTINFSRNDTLIHIVGDSTIATGAAFHVYNNANVTIGGNLINGATNGELLGLTSSVNGIFYVHNGNVSIAGGVFNGEASIVEFNKTTTHFTGKFNHEALLNLGRFTIDNGEVSVMGNFHNDLNSEMKIVNGMLSIGGNVTNHGSFVVGDGATSPTFTITGNFGNQAKRNITGRLSLQSKVNTDIPAHDDARWQYIGWTDRIPTTLPLGSGVLEHYYKTLFNLKSGNVSIAGNLYNDVSPWNSKYADDASAMFTAVYPKLGIIIDDGVMSVGGNFENLRRPVFDPDFDGNGVDDARIPIPLNTQDWTQLSSNITANYPTYDMRKYWMNYYKLLMGEDNPTTTNYRSIFYNKDGMSRYEGQVQVKGGELSIHKDYYQFGTRGKNDNISYFSFRMDDGLVKLYGDLNLVSLFPTDTTKCPRLNTALYDVFLVNGGRFVMTTDSPDNKRAELSTFGVVQLQPINGDVDRHFIIDKNKEVSQMMCNNYTGVDAVHNNYKIANLGALIVSRLVGTYYNQTPTYPTNVSAISFTIDPIASPIPLADLVSYGVKHISLGILSESNTPVTSLQSSYYREASEDITYSNTTGGFAMLEGSVLETYNTFLYPYSNKEYKNHLYFHLGTNTNEPATLMYTPIPNYNYTGHESDYPVIESGTATHPLARLLVNGGLPTSLMPQELYLGGSNNPFGWYGYTTAAPATPVVVNILPDDKTITLLGPTTQIGFTDHGNGNSTPYTFHNYNYQMDEIVGRVKRSNQWLEVSGDTLSIFGANNWGIVAGTDYMFNNAETRITFSEVDSNLSFALVNRGEHSGVVNGWMADSFAQRRITAEHNAAINVAGQPKGTLSSISLGFTGIEVGSDITSAMWQSGKVRLMLGKAITGDNKPTKIERATEEQDFDNVGVNHRGAFSANVGLPLGTAGLATMYDLLLYIKAKDIFATARNGRWSDPDTWVAEKVPAPNDSVLIRHIVWVGLFDAPVNGVYPASLFNGRQYGVAEDKISFNSGEAFLAAKVRIANILFDGEVSGDNAGAEDGPAALIFANHLVDATNGLQTTINNPLTECQSMDWTTPLVLSHNSQVVTTSSPIDFTQYSLFIDEKPNLATWSFNGKTDYRQMTINDLLAIAKDSTKQSEWEQLKGLFILSEGTSMPNVKTLNIINNGFSFNNGMLQVGGDAGQ